MKDINGREAKVGQRVRVTFEGVLERRWSGALTLRSDDGDILIVIAEPRIEEPTGLGAVVRDSEGTIRIRIDQTYAPWRTAGGGPVYREWDDISDPVLLSEGWTDGE